jgi:hypothetical protein
MPVRLVLFQGLSEDRLEEEAAQANLQASQRGAWRHAGAERHPYESKNELKEEFERNERGLEEDEDCKQFFKLFEESTFEGRRAAAQKMKKYAKRQTKQNQMDLLSHSLHILIRSELEMLSWPNSPLLVLLKFVDHNVLFGGENAPQEGRNRTTPLHDLAELADLSTTQPM